MRCPKCGTVWTDGADFCGNCGAVLPKRKKGVLRAFFAAVLFVAIFFTCQSVVLLTHTVNTVSSDSEYMAATENYASVLINSETTEEELNAAVERETNALRNAISKAVNTITEHYSLILLIGDLLAILVVSLIFRIRKREPKKDFRVCMINPARLITFALFGAALFFIVTAVLNLLPFSEQTITDYEAGQTMILGMGDPLPLRIITTVIVVPITEELFFRSLVIRNFKPTIGPAASVIVSAIIFGASHFAFSISSLISVVYAAIVGLLFAAIFVKYDSIIPSIICHAFFNLMDFMPLRNDARTALPILAIAAAVAAFCFYRIFVRYPTFSDVLFNTDSIPAINEEEGRIFERVREMKESTEPVNRDELDELAKAWDDNRRAYKESKKDKSSEE